MSIPRIPGRQCTNAELAKRALEAAERVPGVVCVGPGLPFPVVTYGRPGEAVRGVRVQQSPEKTSVEIHLTSKLVHLPSLAEEVRLAVAGALAGCSQGLVVDIYVDTIEETSEECR